jgi:hypothetical protein
MDNYILRGEHDEFAKRIDAEQDRQNKRLNILEESMKQYVTLTLSVEKMAISIEQMVKEQQKQGEKLEELENAPVKNWNTIKASILSALGGALGTALISAIVYGLANSL